MKQRAAKNSRVNGRGEGTNIAVLRPIDYGVKRGFDPVTVSETVCAAKAQFLRDYGVTLSTSTDFQEFARVRMQCRDGDPQPAFNPAVDHEDLSRTGFWVQGRKNDETVLLSACRLNQVDRDFRDWVIAWQMWLHAMVGDDVSILPPDPNRPVSEMIRSVRGPVVYCGEVWISPDERPSRTGNSRILDHMMQFSYMLAWQLWKPTGLFGLSWYETARSGQMSRMQNPYFERGFYEWRRRPPCVDRPYEAPRPNEEILTFTPKSMLESLVLDVQIRLNEDREQSPPEYSS
ncbi:MAG: hypothetical protein AAF441_13400 [Pseudomonadota bacterium]